MRIISVVGIRSQYIKICAIQRMLKKISVFENQLEMIYINSGQHYDYVLSSGFISELGIHFDQTITYNTIDPIQIFTEMIYRLSNIFLEYNCEKKVDYVMCFGDANTTMAAAIAASKCGIKLVHVEAGLRLKDLNSPEEGNRIVADHLASYLFVSNRSDLLNLEREGLIDKSIFVGDIIYDLVLQIQEEFNNQEIQYLDEDNKYKTYNKTNFILASMHRKENIRDGCLEELFDSFSAIEHDILFIAHPSVMEKIANIKYDKNKITISRQIPYISALHCIAKCRYLITDSGAFQREAYYLSKRCLIRQDIAFWQHLCDIGAHLNIGKSAEEIVCGINEIEKRITREYPHTDHFGNGHAVEGIIQFLLR